MERMLLLLLFGVVCLLFAVLTCYAIGRNKSVRAILKFPFFVFSLEATDENDPNAHSQPTRR